MHVSAWLWGWAYLLEAVTCSDKLVKDDLSFDMNGRRTPCARILCGGGLPYHTGSTDRSLGQSSYSLIEARSRIGAGS